MPVTLDHLRRYAIARSLFKPTSLKAALAKLGFVQADPIRAPARAQDLTLRHRVRGYRAGDLERRYSQLALEEDVFINYGFLARAHHDLMHPRIPRNAWSSRVNQQALAVLDFVRARGTVHPREIDSHFAHGKTTNWFGGSSNASTVLLDGMHFRGLLRVVRREGGTRLYAVRTAALAAAQEMDPATRLDALVDLAIRKYAPVPARSLGELVSRIGIGAPQWRGYRAATLKRTQLRLARSRVEGCDWYWPADERPQSRRWHTDEAVRLLTPFDPVVWDRRRFELFWNWAYRFEAYTPAPKRKLGYYALPLLWREQVMGWANVNVVSGALAVQVGYRLGRAPRDLAFKRALEAELERIRLFLAL